MRHLWKHVTGEKIHTMCLSNLHVKQESEMRTWEIFFFTFVSTKANDMQPNCFQWLEDQSLFRFQGVLQTVCSRLFVIYNALVQQGQHWCDCKLKHIPTFATVRWAFSSLQINGSLHYQMSLTTSFPQVWSNCGVWRSSKQHGRSLLTCLTACTEV